VPLCPQLARALQGQKREHAVKTSRRPTWNASLAAGMLVVGVSGLALQAGAQDVLPRPEPKFEGIIGRTYRGSTPDKMPL